MSLSHLLLGILLILWGLSAAGAVAISGVFLGWFAVVTGAIWLLEAVVSVPVLPLPRRQT